MDFVTVREPSGESSRVPSNVFSVYEDIDVDSDSPSLIANAISKPMVHSVDSIEEVSETPSVNGKLGLCI